MPAKMQWVFEAKTGLFRLFNLWKGLHLPAQIA